MFVHKKIEMSKDIYNQEINTLILGDVPYRYERQSLKMDKIQIVVNSLRSLDESCKEEKSLFIKLSNQHDHGKRTRSIEHEIHSNNEVYELKTEYGAAYFKSQPCGYIGVIYEDYYDDYLGSIGIGIMLPNEVTISEENYIAQFSKAFHIPNLEIITIQDEDIEQDLEEQETDMKISVV